MSTTNKKTLGKTEKKVIRIMIAATVVAAVIFGCLFYVNQYYKATTTARKALIGNDLVEVMEEDSYYRFSLRQEESSQEETTEGENEETLLRTGTGIIFYPGGKVEETAYAPMMLKLAEQGYEVYLVRMPARLAVFGMNRADDIIASAEHIDSWIMMGHSLGGAMAASYSASHDETIDGLILLAAYSTEDLREKEIEVYSFYGSEDKVLNMEKYEKYRDNLPEDAVEVVIDGGNHAYYGFYGEQDGDGVAEISRDEQIETVLDALLTVR